jgi:hypothetical protein
MRAARNHTQHKNHVNKKKYIRNHHNNINNKILISYAQIYKNLTFLYNGYCVCVFLCVCASFYFVS